MNLDNFKQTSKTSHFSIRANAKAMATILKVYKEKVKNLSILTRTDLAKTALEHYAEILVKQYPDCKFELLQDALDYLEAHNLQVNSKNRNKQNILKGLKLENVNFESKGDEFERIQEAKKELK